MATRKEYVFDTEKAPWVQQWPKDTDGNVFKGSNNKTMAEGLDGGPEGFIGIMHKGLETEAHYHNEAQFQVGLEGSLDSPGHHMEALAVHYTDPNTAYGPLVFGGCTVAVLRPRRTSRSIYMSMRENRAFRDPHGRELVGTSIDVEWEELSDGTAFRRKVLFEGDGPAARLFEYAPNSQVQLETAPHGEWQILTAGSARIGDEEIKPYSMRYITGAEAPSSMTVGPDGATWLLLTFDEAADKSGSLPEGVSI